MKNLLTLSLILLSSQAFAGSFTPYSKEDCKKADAHIEVYVTKEYFEPRIIYVQEGDVVCMNVHAVDTAITLSVEKHNAMMSARAGAPAEIMYFRAQKVGEFKIMCQAGCAYKTMPKMVVQPKEQFQKWEEEKYREDAQKYRQRVKPRQNQRDYQSKDPSFNKKKTDNPYETERYRPKVLGN